MSSIRRTLLAALLGPILAVTLAAALLVYRLARQQLDAVFDYHLRQLALSVRDQAAGGAAAGIGAGEGFDFVVQVRDRDGVRLYLSRPVALPTEAQLGFADVRAGPDDWRVYTAELGGLVVQVAQPLRVRERLAFAAAARTLAPVLLLLPLLALLVWRTVGRALAPLDRLATTVAARRPAALEPLPEAIAPEEAVPLVRALNGLLARLGAVLGAQRAFVADAAHELRTPLAALRLQAQLVERAPDAGARAAALADLGAGLDRATRVVEQLLTLARAEPGAARAPAGAPVSLGELVAQAVADHALLAEARRVDLGAVRADEAAAVRGDPEALRTLLANLVENAIRHGREGGRADVAAGADAAGPFLEVTDDGPGIPAPERGRVFDRFYRRGPGRAGSGLGLAIVKAIADAHGAEVALGDAPGGGLRVRVQFPAAASAPGASAPASGVVARSASGRTAPA